MLLSIMIHVALKTQFLISLLFRLNYLFEMTHNFFSIATHQNNFQSILSAKMALTFLNTFLFVF